jgi:RNA polymerase sigma-70 factor (ECF subfamily)
MDEQERAEQLKKMMKGDRDALQRLILHYHPALRKHLEMEVGAALRRHVDPDDVLQHTYTNAFKALPGCSFDGPGGLYKWLEKIADNQLKDRIRALYRDKRDINREVRNDSYTSSSYAELVERLASPQSTPSRQLAQDEVVAAVLSCVARLTDNQRRVVRMRFLEGKSVAETANALDKSEAAVHMLCHRGLKELRKLMGSVSRYLTRA